MGKFINQESTSGGETPEELGLVGRVGSVGLAQGPWVSDDARSVRKWAETEPQKTLRT